MVPGCGCGAHPEVPRGVEDGLAFGATGVQTGVAEPQEGSWPVSLGSYPVLSSPSFSPTSGNHRALWLGRRDVSKKVQQQQRLPAFTFGFAKKQESPGRGLRLNRRKNLKASCNPAGLKMDFIKMIISKLWQKLKGAPPPHPVQLTRKIEQLRPGQIITVRGQIPEGPGRFAVNLKDHNDDIAFHFNPRFDEHQVPYIACNTHTGKSWGPEERTSYVPFEPGDSVEMAIKAGEKYYQVSVNGQPILYYRHRLSFRNVKTVVVTGYLQSSEIQINGLDSSRSPAEEAEMRMNTSNEASEQDPCIAIFED